MKINSDFFLFLVLITITLDLSAQETNASQLEAQHEKQEDLAKELANPLANLISVPIQNNLNMNYGPYDRNVNVLNIQPVIPFANGKIITRVVMPIVSIPDFSSESGMETTGLGDIVLTGFYVPEAKGLIWGFGPVLEFPTGGSARGSEKWSAGPSIVALTQKGDWTFGVLGNNVWSYAGNDERADVNRMLLNIFLVKQLGDGWYVNSVPIITANWEAESGQQWVVPLGLGAGRLLMLGGKFPLNVQTGLYNNVVRPDFGPEWQWRFQVQFVLSKKVFGL